MVHKTKYLGMELTMKNIDLYQNNYEKLWKQIKKDIKWNKLSLSMLGKISVIKMNVFCFVLFVFLQTIPIIKDVKMADGRKTCQNAAGALFAPALLPLCRSAETRQKCNAAIGCKGPKGAAPEETQEKNAWVSSVLRETPLGTDLY